MSEKRMRYAEQATFTPTVLPGVPAPIPACDLCGAYVARRELHEQWHRQFTHESAIDIEWTVS